MTIAFFSNILNIHQAYIADELYEQTNHNYWFVSFEPLTKETLKGGKDEFKNRAYHLKAYESDESWNKALELAKEADVMVYGHVPITFVSERLKLNKLTFQYSERWLKRGLVNLLSPRLLKQQWYYHTQFFNKPLYCLCSSAYAASDYKLMHTYQDRCYKWGYFTAVNELNIAEVLNQKRNASTVKILWVARFLQLKHPFRMLQLGSRLRNRQIDFEIEMVGMGPEYDRIANDIDRLGLSDCIKLNGALPNNEVLRKMRESHIFCFTSDRNEGWGAVLNEAMSNGCCPVANKDIGSVPFLIDNAKNGFIYDGEDDLFEKVLWLIEHPREREDMSRAAYETMRNIWCPANAAHRLIELSKSLLDKMPILFEDGPCSKAEVL